MPSSAAARPASSRSATTRFSSAAGVRFSSDATGESPSLSCAASSPRRLSSRRAARPCVPATAPARRPARAAIPATARRRGRHRALRGGVARGVQRLREARRSASSARGRFRVSAMRATAVSSALRASRPGHCCRRGSAPVARFRPRSGRCVRAHRRAAPGGSAAGRRVRRRRDAPGAGTLRVLALLLGGQRAVAPRGQAAIEFVFAPGQRFDLGAQRLHILLAQQGALLGRARAQHAHQPAPRRSPPGDGRSPSPSFDCNARASARVSATRIWRGCGGSRAGRAPSMRANPQGRLRRRLRTRPARPAVAEFAQRIDEGFRRFDQHAFDQLPERGFDRVLPTRLDLQRGADARRNRARAGAAMPSPRLVPARAPRAAAFPARRGGRALPARTCAPRPVRTARCGCRPAARPRPAFALLDLGVEFGQRAALVRVLRLQAGEGGGERVEVEVRAFGGERVAAAAGVERPGGRGNRRGCVRRRRRGWLRRGRGHARPSAAASRRARLRRPAARAGALRPRRAARSCSGSAAAMLACSSDSRDWSLPMCWPSSASADSGFRARALQAFGEVALVRDLLLDARARRRPSYTAACALFSASARPRAPREPVSISRSASRCSAMICCSRVSSCESASRRPCSCASRPRNSSAFHWRP